MSEARVQVWFSNRRARLRKTISSAAGSSSFGSGLSSVSGNYAATSGSEAVFSGGQASYQWPANPYLNYGAGYCQGAGADKAQYYNTAGAGAGASWRPATKMEAVSWPGAASQLQEYS